MRQHSAGVVVLACVHVWILAASVMAEQTVGPAVMMWSPQAAMRLRQQALGGDPTVSEAVKSLCSKADDALSVGPFSVTDKKFLPPSNDPHDFSCIGRYYWPNPDTPDGLPWIRRDGETNPMYFDPDFGDSDRLVDLWRAVLTLSRAYYLTDHEPYADKAAQLLRVWFIDPATRMNPNALYAGRFPGNWDGVCWGIHVTRQVADIADAIGLLQGSTAWTAQDQQAIQQWYAEYLDWLLTSERGIEEGNTTNNHAVAYDWLVVRLAVFTDKQDTARQILEQAKTRRIAAQIEPDGSMPAELARAKPWNYEGYALEFFFKLAILGDRMNVDLWHYRTDDGRGIQSALDYVVAHVKPQDDQIDHTVLDEMGVTRIGPLLAVAAKVYDQPRYLELMQKLDWDDHLDLTRSGPAAALMDGP